MNRPAKLLRWSLPVALGLALASCEEDTSPWIAKLEVTPECGSIVQKTEPIFDNEGNVIGERPVGEPAMEVDFFARATGGNEKPDPTGSNTPLDMTWDFGDGTIRTNVVSGTHRYLAAGIYTVTVTVKDEDGDEDSQSREITVGAEGEDVDVLEIAAQEVGMNAVWNPVTQPCPGGGTRIANWTFQGYKVDFEGILSTPCEVKGLAEFYVWEWNFGDGNTQLHEADTSNTFPDLDTTYTVTLTVTETASSTTRTATFDVTTPAGTGPKPATTTCP